MIFWNSIKKLLGVLLWENIFFLGTKNMHIILNIHMNQIKKCFFTFYSFYFNGCDNRNVKTSITELEWHFNIYKYKQQFLWMKLEKRGKVYI